MLSYYIEFIYMVTNIGYTIDALTHKNHDLVNVIQPNSTNTSFCTNKNKK